MIEKAVIDRFEGYIAVLLLGDDGSRRLDIPRKQLPKGVRAGTWLTVELEGETLRNAEIDADATSQAKARIQEKLARLRRGDHRKDNEECGNE